MGAVRTNHVPSQSSELRWHTMRMITTALEMAVCIIRCNDCRPSKSQLDSSLRKPCTLVMDTKSQRPKGREGAPPLLNAAIEALNPVREISDTTPAKAAFDSVSALLTMARVRFPPILRR